MITTTNTLDTNVMEFDIVLELSKISRLNIYYMSYGLYTNYKVKSGKGITQEIKATNNSCFVFWIKLNPTIESYLLLKGSPYKHREFVGEIRVKEVPIKSRMVPFCTIL